MKRLRFLIGMAILGFVGCVSTDGDVIGRSATRRPGWATGEKIPDSANDFYVYYKKSDIYRLELGVRQAQAGAKQESKQLMLARLRTELFSRAEKMKLNTKEVLSAIESAVADFSKDFVVSEARPIDTYHEQIERDTPEGKRQYFDVYVLLAMPREELGEALIQIANKLSQASEPKAQQLSAEIKKELQE